MKNHTIKVTATCTYQTEKGECGKKTTQTHPYCNHHTKITTGFYVAKSGIEGAGYGLYTDRDLKKGTTLMEYTGEHISTKVFQDRYGDDGFGSYAMTLNKSTVIDARETSAGIARYICDFFNSGKTANVKFESTGRRVEITAIKDIKAGEELLVNYGKDMRRALGFYKKKKS